MLLSSSPHTPAASLAEDILREVGSLLAELGDGGKVSPAIYDTAQLLRLDEHRGQRTDTYAWLLDLQQADGGWGEPELPLYREVPTLAAMLALHDRDAGVQHRASIAAARSFLAQRQGLWKAPLPGIIPAGMELIVLRLCEQAQASGIDLPAYHYTALIEAGRARLAKLERMGPLPLGSPPLHCWEAWGTDPAAVTLDEFGSLGASPAATAAWLHLARHRGMDPALLDRARGYLAKAAAATGSPAPGVTAPFWPIEIFEPAWTLYTLALGGLFHLPPLADSVMRASVSLRVRMTGRGVGFSRAFAPDGDCTAVAMAVLAMAGLELPENPLRHYDLGDAFLTYPGESSGGLSTTIHAIHALRLRGEPADRAEAFLEQHRDSHGIWSRDKWHASWLYPTSHAIAALSCGRQGWSDPRALAALLGRQHRCGGWGAGSQCTFEETAYAVLALSKLAAPEQAPAAVAEAMDRALQWMLQANRQQPGRGAPLLIDKELYSLDRVARVTELTGLWVAIQWTLEAQDAVAGRPQRPASRTRPLSA